VYEDAEARGSAFDETTAG